MKITIICYVRENTGYEHLKCWKEDLLVQNALIPQVHSLLNQVQEVHSLAELQERRESPVSWCSSIVDSNKLRSHYGHC
jgi:hypothetical protein